MPNIVSEGSDQAALPAPEGTLVLKPDGTFELTVSSPPEQHVSGKWDAKDRVLTFHVPDDAGKEHAFDGSLSEDGETLKAFGFQFKRR